MRRISEGILIFAFLMLSTGMLPAQQTFNVLRSGSDCGRLTLEFDRLANGYMQCELREERRFIGVDGKSVDWRRNLTVLVDSGLHILSVSGKEFTEAGDFSIKGSGVNGVIYFTRESKDGQVESWREDGSAIPDIFLPEFAVRADIPTPDKVFFVRDLISRRKSVHVSDLEDGSLRIVIGDGSEFVTSSSGVISSWSMPSLDIAWASDGASRPDGQACNIDCEVFWDAGQVALPTEIDNIRSMKVRLTITKDVGARLVPEDIRQKIADDSPSGAAVLLQINRVRQQHGEVTLPILDADKMQYQKESPMLPVTADAVRERAAILRKVTKSAGAVASDIQGWMKDEFIFDEFVPVVSADKLVGSSRGNSLHASMLLVTVARASGIPSRLVLGIRPDGDRWRSAVWCEVWTGHWLSIDPVTGEFIDDAAYVKLLHASDVSELREQAKRLRGAVRLDLISVEQFDEGAAGKISTGIYNGAYSDRAYKCIVRAPQDWIIERKVMGTQTDVIMTPEAGSAIRFEMQLTTTPYPLATKDVFDAKVLALGAVLIDAQILEKGEVRFGKRKVPYVLYSYRDTRPGAGETRITTADCIFTASNRGYLFRFTAPSTLFHDYDSVLQNILQNITLFEN